MLDPYENLANAIILRAVQDYRIALKKIKKHPNDVLIQARIRECERFFLSQWFIELTNLDGKMLLKKLKEEAGA